MLESAWGMQTCVTSTDSSADIDALILSGGVISAALEIKSREMDLDQLRRFEVARRGGGT
jgi:hypothetical protein